MAFFVDNNRNGHVIISITPENEFEEPQLFFTDLDGLTSLKHLIAQTENTVEQVKQSGRMLKVGF